MFYAYSTHLGSTMVVVIEAVVVIHDGNASRSQLSQFLTGNHFIEQKKIITRREQPKVLNKTGSDWSIFCDVIFAIFDRCAGSTKWQTAFRWNNHTYILSERVFNYEIILG